MKNFLKTFRVIIPAGEEASALAATGDNLAVYETNAPFIVRDDSGSLYEIDRACRVESLEKDGFGRLTLLRPPGVTGDIVIKLAVGSGVRLFDGRLQYTSLTNNAPVVQIGAVQALPVPPRRARFMPKITAALNMFNEPKYFADHAAAPKISASTPAALNLLAPANLAARKRVVRLLSGASASVGFGEGAPGPSVPGHAFTLTAANPEREIDGAEALFGISGEDCTLSVLEITESASGALTQVPAQVTANLTPAEIALLPAPTLGGSVSFSWEPGCTTTVQNYTPTTDGLAVAAHFSGAVRNWPNSADGVNVLHSMSFSGVTLAMMANYLAAFGPASTATVAQKNPFANSVHWRFLLNGAGTINFSTGQKFTYSDANGATYFRVIFHYDGRVWAQKFNNVTNLWEGSL